MSNKSGASEQIISTPKGGGALSGLGEKFSPDLHSGTGNFSIPIALPRGRNGFQPDLQLSYSTGYGNSEFGLGWNLNLPGVVRKTSHGLPLYGAAFYQGREDTFILTGADDLVKVDDQLQYTGYRPRTEGLFAKIFHHQSQDDDYWEVKTKDGLISYYGAPGRKGEDSSVISNPENSNEIFSWKLNHTKDRFGNKVEYEYETHANSFGDKNKWNNHYLTEIRYVDFEENGKTSYLVKIRFIYDQERPDIFSQYKSGFEIRTSYRCKFIEIHSHPDPHAGDILTRVYEFVYLDSLFKETGKELIAVQNALLLNPTDNDLIEKRTRLESFKESLFEEMPPNNVSLLNQLKVTGYNENGDSEILPPIALGYTKYEPLKRKFARVTGSDLPSNSLASSNYEMADLTGNGLPDILEMNGNIRFWRNLGNGKFDIPQIMNEGPGGLQLSDPDVQLIDANGDGQIDLLVNNNNMNGYFSLKHGGYWDKKSFQPYKYTPSFSLEDPEVKLMDIDGDGITDILRSGSRLECYFNHKSNGWEQTRTLDRKPLVEFPNINFSDSRIKLGDMTGDGLQDIITVYDGNVEYWPNKGYGNWGRQRQMLKCPRFPSGYNPERILVGDIDGDGLADIIYADNNKITVWINQSGNSWSDPLLIKGTPTITDTDAVRLVDLLGTGVAGILWSASARSDRRPHLYYLDLTGGVKPYLLNSMKNNMGSETHVEYKSSVQYYLEDEKRLSTRWKTSLPFPIHVVSKVEVFDNFSRGKLTTLYHYHHGYWDGAEREFQGFGRVEHLDSESFENYHEPGPSSASFAQVENKYFTSPILNKTWFHQGAVGDEYGKWEVLDYSSEYWSGDLNLLNRSYWQPFPVGIPRRAQRDAVGSLRGNVLRTETYAIDGSSVQDKPYTVTESAYGVREEIISRIQSDNHIFFPFSTARRITQWERGNDPMFTFSFAAEYDSVGQSLMQTQVACPRGWKNINDQVEYLATRSRIMYAEPISNDVFIRDRIAKVLNFEILNPQLETIVTLATKPDNQLTLKTIGCTLSFYDEESTSTPGFGQLNRFGALTRTESLMFTQEILEEAYVQGIENLVPPYFNKNSVFSWTADYPTDFRNSITQSAGYFYRTAASGNEYVEGYYAITSKTKFDFFYGAGKGLVIEQFDPLNHSTTIEYDKFRLFPTKVSDANDLLTQADYNYAHMQPWKVTDANNNETVFTFTPLGLLKESWVKGNPAKMEGDRARPSVKMEYGFLEFANSDIAKRKPVYVRNIQWKYHDTDADVTLATRDETITSIQYSDGFGRVIQTRTQASDVYFGNLIVEDCGLPEDQLQNGAAAGNRLLPHEEKRVVVSGLQVYNNKGKAVEIFEPFFDLGWEFKIPQAAQQGVKASIFYDPRNQVIRTVNPDFSIQHVIYGVPNNLADPPQSPTEIHKYKPSPWEVFTYDVNDNAGRTHIHDPLVNGYNFHWNTPSSIEINAQGKTIKSIIRHRNRPISPGDLLPPIEEHVTKSKYDINGNLLETTDVSDRKAIAYTYDLGDRPLRTYSLDAGSRFIFLNAAGKLIESRDSKGALTLQTYDMLNRPGKTWARDDYNTFISLRREVKYGDEIPLLNNAGLNNLLGKPIIHYDESGFEQFVEFDFKGNVLSKIRKVISDDSLIKVYNPAPVSWSNNAFRVDWTAGQQPDLDEKEFETTVKYDAINRIKEIECPKDVNGIRHLIKAEYNVAGLLDKIKFDDTVYVDNIAYNAKGQRILIIYGNKLMTRFTYDRQTFRLLRIRTERYTSSIPFTYTPAGGTLQDNLYNYDLAGNIIQINERVPGCGVQGSPDGSDHLQRNFQYDPIYRLIYATGRCSANINFSNPWLDAPQPGFNSWNHGTPNQDNSPQLTALCSEKFNYEAAGNLIKYTRQCGQNVSSRTFTTDGINNQLSAVTIGSNTTYNYSYNVNGNIASENSERKFEWDFADRMKTFFNQAGSAEPSIHVQYLYDAAGNRIKKLSRKQGGEIRVTVYINGFFEYHKLVKPNTTEENNMIEVRDGQIRIATIRIGNSLDSNDVSPGIQYHLSDHLSSCHILCNESGSLINREEFFSYGETSFGSFRYKRYRFTGKECDEESGLYYYGARYYMAYNARWLSPDPAGPVDSLNLYLYVNSNPINYIDPTGMQEESSGSESAPNICYEPEVYRNEEGMITIHIHSRSSNVIHKTKPPDSTLTEGSDQPAANENKSVVEDSSSSISLPEVGQSGTGVTALGKVLGQLSDFTSRTSVLWTGSIARDGAFWLNQTRGFTVLETSMLGRISYAISNPILQLTRNAEWARSMLYNVVWKPVSAVYGFMAGIKGNALMKLIQTNLNIPKFGFGNILRNIEAPAYRLGLAARGFLRGLGKKLPIIGGILSGVGLLQDIQSGDVASGVGNALGLGAAVTTGSVSLVLTAGAVGYAVGSILNTYIFEPLIDKAAPGSGPLGDWYYRTFLK